MESRQTKSGETEVLVHMDEYDVDGNYLDRAGSGYDESARPAVNFSFNTPGATRFGALTGDNLPDRISGSYSHLGIILDGRLFSAPRLISAITSQGQITGDFTQDEVEFIVEILNAGHLPAALAKTPVSETNISPQLGEDTIRNGSIAMIVSTIAILIFMAVYYRFAGLVANLAVLMNILLVVACMILFKAAFTLAGLAGTRAQRGHGGGRQRADLRAHARRAYNAAPPSAWPFAMVLAAQWRRSSIAISRRCLPA